jgi:hypothetical protein
MSKHRIVTVLSAGTASALVLVLGAAGPPFLPDAAAAATRATAGGRAASPGGTWGNAEQVPGSAALNPGGAAEVRSVSCGAPGNCSTGGNITGSTGSQAWVASESNGTWRHARDVAVALNAGGNGEVSWVSCPSAGNCGAGGSYANRSAHLQAFVLNEVNGTWRAAREVAGAFNTGGNAQIYTLSCGSAGTCSAGGYYRDSSGHYQAFVVDENNGNWGAAQQVPGTAALNSGGNASTGSVSCASAGNCAAAGQYLDRSRHTQVFVVDQVHGRWHRAEEVPGTAALNTGGFAQIAVSCASAGNCSAGGSYADLPGHPHHWQAFVVDEVHGKWGHAQEVPGTTALNKGGNAGVAALSCASANYCGAGGYYRHTRSDQQPFVVNKS